LKEQQEKKDAKKLLDDATKAAEEKRIEDQAKLNGASEDDKEKLKLEQEAAQKVATEKIKAFVIAANKTKNAAKNAAADKIKAETAENAKNLALQKAVEEAIIAEEAANKIAKDAKVEAAKVEDAKVKNAKKTMIFQEQIEAAAEEKNKRAANVEEQKKKAVTDRKRAEAIEAKKWTTEIEGLSEQEKKWYNDLTDVEKVEYHNMPAGGGLLNRRASFLNPRFRKISDAHGNSNNNNDDDDDEPDEWDKKYRRVRNIKRGGGEAQISPEAEQLAKDIVKLNAEIDKLIEELKK
jgi:hypothetical protein